MYVLIDTETTGLHNADVIQFSMIILDEDLNIVRVIDQYCKTDKIITSKAYSLHGISNEKLDKLASKYLEDYVLDTYKEYFFGKDVVFIAYNAPFDINIISKNVLDNTGQEVPFGVYINAPKDKVEGKSCIFDLMKFTNHKMGLLGLCSRTGRFKLNKTVETMDAVYGGNCFEEFGMFCEALGLPATDISYHNSLYDTYCMYYLLMIFKDELF